MGRFGSWFLGAAFGFVGAACLTGCAQPDHAGKCVVEKSDGQVRSVQVKFPHTAGTEANVTIKDREAMDKVIHGLEAIVAELKAARDQMPVQEPPPPEKPQ